MALPGTGAISLSQVKSEFGGPNNLSAYVRGGTYVPNTGGNVGVATSVPITLLSFHGAAAVPMIVSVNAGGYSATSGDGSSWTNRANLPDNTWYKVVWNGSVWVATGSIAVAYSSDSGQTWGSVVYPPESDLKALAWNGYYFVALGPADGSAHYSHDGVSWSLASVTGYYNWSAVEWNGTVFCAVTVGSSTSAATSPDGITWTARTLPAARDWIDIAWNGSVFCAVGQNSSSAATSADGITWTARTLPISAYWIGIKWNGTVFCAVASGATTYTYTSPDGVTWTQRTGPTAYASNLSVSGGTFCLTATNVATTWNSTDGISWNTGGSLHAAGACLGGSQTKIPVANIDSDALGDSTRYAPGTVSEGSSVSDSTGIVTVTPYGGTVTTNYTYAWERVGASNGLSTTLSLSGNAMGWTASAVSWMWGDYISYGEIWRCKVTDTLGKFTYTPPITVEIDFDFN